MRMMLCSPEWMRAGAGVVAGVLGGADVGADVVGVGVGAADVGEAEAGVGDGDADERWLGDADALADWDVRADADADALAGGDVPWDDDAAALAEEDALRAAAEEEDAEPDTPGAPRPPAGGYAAAEDVSPAGTGSGGRAVMSAAVATFSYGTLQDGPQVTVVEEVATTPNAMIAPPAAGTARAKASSL